MVNFMLLLLLHSTFLLSVVKLMQKGEVGIFELNSHGNYIVDHGKIIKLCFLISVGTLKVAESSALVQAEN